MKVELIDKMGTDLSVVNAAEYRMRKKKKNLKNQMND